MKSIVGKIVLFAMALLSGSAIAGAQPEAVGSNLAAGYPMQPALSPSAATFPCPPGTYLVTKVDRDGERPVCESASADLQLIAGVMFDGVLATSADLTAPPRETMGNNFVPFLITVSNSTAVLNVADAKEFACTLIASGSPDFASQRVNVRTESMTCVRHTTQGTQTVSSRVDGFVVDGDDKVGLRGQVVRAGKNELVLKLPVDHNVRIVPIRAARAWRDNVEPSVAQAVGGAEQQKGCSTLPSVKIGDACPMTGMVGHTSIGQLLSCRDGKWADMSSGLDAESTTRAARFMKMQKDIDAQTGPLSVEGLRAMYPRLLESAIDSPTDEKVVAAYMYAQRVILDRAERAAQDAAVANKSAQQVE